LPGAGGSEGRTRRCSGITIDFSSEIRNPAEDRKEEVKRMGERKPGKAGTGYDPTIVYLVCAVLFLGFLLILPVSAQESGGTGDTVQGAPLNPAFVTYMQKTQAPQKMMLSAVTHQATTDPLGLIPSPVSRPGVTVMPTYGAGPGGSAYPPTFDLRTSGKVSPVKDQTYFGTCWAFASMGSLESTLMPATPAPDFSEKNLANLAGFDYAIPDGGGNMWMSAAYMTRWNGPVNEATDPYPSGREWSASGTYPPVEHVQNIVFFPGRLSRSDTTGIKKALTTQGAVYSAFYWHSSFYNATHTSYYEPASASDPSSGGGHAVTIVGWDNTWKASNFTTAPDGPGAWIVKNSWGTDWGDNGYFYLSYYDKYFGSAVQSSGGYWDTGVFTGESTSSYNALYSYDTHGDVQDYYVTIPKTGSFANVFTATSPGTLAAVGFYTTDLNVPCTISIYKNPAPGPVDDTTPAAQFSTTLPDMGYHTVAIPSGLRVPLTTGDKFSVVVNVTNPTNNYFIPTEFNYPGYTSGITSQYGQSYVLGSSGWEDWKDAVDNSHICIKAYTTPVQSEAETTGSGGDSGSSGVGGSTAATVSGIVAGQPATFSFHQNPGPTAPVALDAVQITFSQSPGTVNVVGLPVSNGGSPPGQTVIGYIQIEPVGINPDAVSQGVISFSVNGPWLASHDLTPAQVVLLRNHDSQWTALPATLLRQSGDTYYYEATTPGFSYFAIVAGTGTAAATATVTVTTLPTTVVTNGNSTPTTTVTSTRTPVSVKATAIQTSAPVTTGTTAVPAAGAPAGGSGGFPIHTLLAGIGGIAILSAGAVLVRRWWIRRQNPALFRKYD
jgi:PGF-pre-PGF domain-containing protein